MKKVFFFLIGLFLLVNLQAQKGAITGTIYDATGEVLYGANVVVEGTGTGAQTDYIDGKYTFQIEPGVYNLIASYIGYPDTRLSGITVKANGTTVVDFVMEENTGIELAEVVVVEKALERSENAVLLLRKKSDKVQDIISSAEISRLGAGDAAAALTKVTGTTIVDGKYVYVRGLGDRYSATTLNGLRLPSIDPYRNSAQLDLIPTSLLDNIVTSKTFTPDLPGDFTGGSVNIKLKNLPERFTWSVSASTAYNAQNNLRDDFQSYSNPGQSRLGFNDGTLDLPSVITDAAAIELGAFDRSAAREARRDDALATALDKGVRSLNGSMAPTTTSNTLDYGLSASIGNQFTLGEMKVGVFATLGFAKDYSQYQGGVNASYVASPGEEQLIQNFNLTDDRSEESPSLNGMVGLSLRPNSANSINLYAIYSHQAFLEGRTLQGTYDDYGIGGANNYFLSQTQSFMERELIDYVVSGEHTLVGLNNMRIEWAANYVDSRQDEPNLRFLAYGFENDRYDINESLFNLPSRFWRDLSDDAYQGKLDITLPFLQKKDRGNSIKFGGFYNTKSRDFNEVQYIYGQRNEQRLNDLDGDVAQYFGSENIGIIGGEPGSNRIGLYLIDNSLLSNSYTGQFDIAAGYLMTSLQFGNLKVVGGVRGEQTSIFVESDIVPNEYRQAELANRPVDSLRIANNQAKIDTFSFLPALNLIYSLGDKANLRLSATQTIARPNMREVAPFGSFGFIGDPTVFGNPNLNLTRINNFDIRYELFPNAGEVLAVSAFYKQFNDPIVQTYRFAGNPQFTWVNTDKGNLYGVELEVRKNLDFVSSKLDDFSVSANFAYINSQVTIDERECALSREIDPEFKCERQFAGQSPIVANFNLSYTNADNGWDAILAYNYFGDRLTAVGAVGAPDIFEKGRGQLDFSLSKEINNLKISLRARNLLDPNYRRFSDFNGEEYVFSNYRRGRELSFGLSYSM
ncbi:MAG: hypothetical protein DA408_03925 [Bacteroidetes bacterium]|nr:MAG: hypothetical protein C7N36_08555 [Bacteroidota bacterium]PTM14227.1 MAG: hypothetical protein DA408_03925 [Bacteroidota bacterium]